MFRDRPSRRSQALLFSAIAMLLAIIAAVGVTFWLVQETRKEQRAIERLVAGETEEIPSELSSLPDELRLQLVFSVLLLLVLLAAAVVVVFVLRAYFVSQRSLREVKLLASDILGSMEQGVVTTDCDGKITSCNPRAYELLAIERDCVGLPLADICGDEIPLDRLSDEVLTSKKIINDRDFSVTNNGHASRYRAHCHLLQDADGEVLGTVAHVRDVTERYFIEQRMQRMERFMGLGTLAAGLHHEIKNPLGALSLHVQLLEESLEEDQTSDVNESLGVLKTEVSRINGVLESFRDYASADRLNQHETDITQLAQQTIDLIRPKAEQQNVQIDLQLIDDLPHISADSARLEQVLLNLVINALEEMQDGGTLAVMANCDENSVQISVTDSGSGIPESIRSRIFDPYFTTKSEGSGMGLAVCDKIIRQHGGHMDVEAKEKGTTFRVVLPFDV